MIINYYDQEDIQRTTDLPCCSDLAINNHLTDFTWSNTSLGPAQLALAILCHFTKDKEYSLKHYQDFKKEVTSKIKQEQWKMEADQVAGWVADNP